MCTEATDICTVLPEQPVSTAKIEYNHELMLTARNERCSMYYFETSYERHKANMQLLRGFGEFSGKFAARLEIMSPVRCAVFAPLVTFETIVT